MPTRCRTPRSRNGFLTRHWHRPKTTPTKTRGWDKIKTRPGGQPDGSSYMGAWGGWALAPYTASLGRDNRSHTHWSPKGCGTFKPPWDFFNFFGRNWPDFRREFWAGNLLRGGAIGLARRRLLGRAGGGRMFP